MLSFEPEITALHADGVLSDDEASRLIAITRRDVVSISREIRLLAWAGVLLLITGISLFLKEHYYEVGPIAIVVLVALLAAGCYFFAFRHRARVAEGKVEEYVLLLGALILSADVGFAESQFHFFGSQWTRHLLLLALLHAATAYFFSSRMVLSASLTALAAWFGIERNASTFFDSGSEVGTRAFFCAGAVALWRLANMKTAQRIHFRRVFDHFAANLSLWGGVLWCCGSYWRFALPVMLLLAAGWILYARREREEMFLLYGIGYGYVGTSGVLTRFATSRSFDSTLVGVLTSLWFIVTVPLVIIVTIVAWRRMRGQE